MKPITIIRLDCGCTLQESVNKRLTKTDLKLWRSKGCDRVSHFTQDTGWPQIVEARNAEVLHREPHTLSA